MLCSSAQASFTCYVRRVAQPICSIRYDAATIQMALCGNYSRQLEDLAFKRDEMRIGVRCPLKVKGLFLGERPPSSLQFDISITYWFARSFNDHLNPAILRTPSSSIVTGNWVALSRAARRAAISCEASGALAFRVDGQPPVL